MKLSTDLGPMAWPYERKCPICGKVFCMWHADLWAYKTGERYFCSYHCMSAALKKTRESSAGRPKRKKAYPSASTLKPKQKFELIKALIRTGLTNREIEMKTGIDRELVRYYRVKAERESEKGGMENDV